MQGRWVLAAVLLLTASSASAQPPRESSRPGRVAAARRPPASSAIADASIAAAITSLLFTDRYFTPGSLRVTVDDGVISLTGTVDTLRSRDRAIAVAESVRGVRSVVDRLRVVARERPDDRLALDVVRALARDPTTDAYKVKVAVDGGVVTLRGTVGSWAERDLTAWVAKGVAGVREVHNLIHPDFTKPRADVELRQDIEGLLARDPWLEADAIRVDVHGGRVALSGTVPSAAARTRALRLAWVAGVKDVDGGHLEAHPAIAATPLRQSPAITSRTDREIAAAIRDALLRDPRVSAFYPDIKVERGVVRLTGTVTSYLARQAAGAAARHTPGVAVVENLLAVYPTRRGDSAIADDVREALRTFAPELADRVTVTVRQAQVTLTGTVATPHDRWRAWDAAARVRGVAAVDDQVRLAPPVAVARDADLERAVEEAIGWDALLEPGDRIEVAADRGKVRLRGSVDTWAELQAAVQDAFLAGATEVTAELRVKGSERAQPMRFKVAPDLPEQLLEWAPPREGG